MADQRHPKQHRLLGQLLEPALVAEPGGAKAELGEPPGGAVHHRLDTESLGKAAELARRRRPLPQIDEVRLDPPLGEEPEGFPRLAAFLHAEDLNFHGAGIYHERHATAPRPCRRGETAHVYETALGVGLKTRSARVSRRFDLNCSVPERQPDYSMLVRTVLILCAVVLAFLPVPVTLLGLLPTYRAHARFLVFYAPLICVLTLGYLVYLRDSIARVLFAGQMLRSDEVDPYYRQTFKGWLGHTLGQIRNVFVACLPGLLVLASYFCVTRYAARMNESVSLAADMYSMQQQPRPHMGGAAVDTMGTSGAGGPANAQIVGLSDVPRLRNYALREAGLQDIPFFTELTALYIGAFVCALAAVITMLLKEYAKESIGLTETELVLGQMFTEPGGGPS